MYVCTLSGDPRCTILLRCRKLHYARAKSDYGNASARCRGVINGAQGARYSGRALRLFGCMCALRCAFRCITAKKPRGARAEISVHGSWLFCRVNRESEREREREIESHAAAVPRASERRLYRTIDRPVVQIVIDRIPAAKFSVGQGFSNADIPRKNFIDCVRGYTSQLFKGSWQDVSDTI